MFGSQSVAAGTMLWRNVSAKLCVTVGRRTEARRPSFASPTSVTLKTAMKSDNNLTTLAALTSRCADVHLFTFIKTKLLVVVSEYKAKCSSYTLWGPWVSCEHKKYNRTSVKISNKQDGWQLIEDHTTLIGENMKLVWAGSLIAYHHSQDYDV